MHFACAACKGLSGRFLVKCTLGIYLYGRMEASSGGFMSIPGSDGAGAERRHVQLIISVLVGIGRPVIPAAAGCGFRPRVLSDRRPQPCLFPEPKRVSPAAQSPARRFDPATGAALQPLLARAQRCYCGRPA